MTLSDVQAAFLEQIDIDESYRFAKELEQFKSNPALGYRTAGSQAEFDAGEQDVYKRQRSTQNIALEVRKQITSLRPKSKIRVPQCACSRLWTS